MIWIVVITGLLVLMGAFIRIIELREQAAEYQVQKRRDAEGWLYFVLRDERGSFGTMKDTSDRPQGLVFMQEVINMDDALERARQELKGSCIKDNWYDGQAVKAYISHLKGEW